MTVCGKPAGTWIDWIAAGVGVVVQSPDKIATPTWCREVTAMPAGVLGGKREAELKNLRIGGGGLVEIRVVLRL